MAIKTIVSIVIYFLSFNAFAGDKEKILELIKKSNAAYESAPKFQTDVNYKLYASATSKTVTEAYSGTIIKSGKDVYTKIHTTEFVQIGARFIKIDHNNKAVEYSSINKQADNNFYSMINNYLQYFSKFELATEGNLWKCVLSTAELSMVPYSKVVIYIDKATNRITKQVLYFLVKNEYKDAAGKAKKDYPRLEIIPSNYTDKNIPVGNKLNLANYIQVDNNTISLVSRLSAYTLIDLTK
jgi:hypothetical protein